MVNVYKIKRSSDGKYSNGGSKPSFTARGKSWETLGYLKSHLRMMRSDPEYYDGCEVVAYKLVEDVDQTYDLNGWVDLAKKDRTADMLAGKRRR